jgi:hypothetical protein
MAIVMSSAAGAMQLRTIARATLEGSGTDEARRQEPLGAGGLRHRGRHAPAACVARARASSARRPLVNARSNNVSRVRPSWSASA